MLVRRSVGLTYAKPKLRWWFLRVIFRAPVSAAAPTRRAGAAGAGGVLVGSGVYQRERELDSDPDLESGNSSIPIQIPTPLMMDLTLNQVLEPIFLEKQGQNQDQNG